MNPSWFKNALFVVIVCVLFSAVSAKAASVTFQWDPNTETDLSGYALYQSDTSGQYDFSAPVAGNIPKGDTEYTLKNVSDGTHYWVLKAFDTEGLYSGPSNEVSFSVNTMPPAAPSGLVGFVQKIISWIRGLFLTAHQA